VSGAERLAGLLKGPETVVAPGVYDGLSARIAAAAGFPPIYCSGGAVARSSGAAFEARDEIVDLAGWSGLEKRYSD
jgi:2-methylisocitrate lyase-like PEP mutase family enzyme